MNWHPIIFTGESLPQIQAGDKTQTRRLMRLQPVWRDGAWFWQSPRYDNGDGVHYFHTQVLDGVLEAWASASPHGVPGDRLYVKEKLIRNNEGQVAYAWDGRRATKRDNDCFRLVQWSETGWRRDWLSPRYMPRWASRLSFGVTNVRVHRVNDISRKDCISEGMDRDMPLNDYGTGARERDSFAARWDSLNKKRGHGWDKNDWVFATTFKLLGDDNA